MREWAPPVRTERADSSVHGQCRLIVAARDPGWVVGWGSQAFRQGAEPLRLCPHHSGLDGGGEGGESGAVGFIVRDNSTLGAGRRHAASAVLCPADDMVGRGPVIGGLQGAQHPYARQRLGGVPSHVTVSVTRQRPGERPHRLAYGCAQGGSRRVRRRRVGRGRVLGAGACGADGAGGELRQNARRYRTC
eukprot:scaffold7161_cov109-Isochrysis_galbana.AAC.4